MLQLVNLYRVTLQILRCGLSWPKMAKHTIHGLKGTVCPSVPPSISLIFTPLCKKSQTFILCSVEWFQGKIPDESTDTNQPKRSSSPSSQATAVVLVIMAEKRWRTRASAAESGLNPTGGLAYYSSRSQTRVSRAQGSPHTHLVWPT